MEEVVGVPESLTTPTTGQLSTDETRSLVVPTGQRHRPVRVCRLRRAGDK